MAQAGSEMAWRAVLPPLVKDYAVEYQAEQDLLGPSATPEMHILVGNFKKLVRGKRDLFQEEAITAMHATWQKAGGRFISFPDATLDVHLSALRNSENLVEGGMMVSGDYGSIDPSLLNQGLSPFKGGAGQILLLSALAVTTDHANGDMQKAYIIASALLSKTDFKKLEWGKAIYLKVNEVDREKEKLRNGLADGTYKEETGWLRYVATVFVSPQSAWQNASVLLGETFAQLGWPTNQEAVRLARKKAA